MTWSTLPLALASSMLSVTNTGLAPSVGAVDAHDVRLAAASRIPPALAANVTLNDPSAVVAALAPSLSVSVAVEPDTATDASVAADGAEVSVHPVLPAVYAASDSEKSIVTWSTLPLALTSFITIDTRPGLALSSGAAVANEAVLPAASLTPRALPAIATVIDPTVVSAAPTPSVIVSVAVVVATATDASVPPDGVPDSVHGAVPAL